ncbi:MAG: YdcF family protein [Acidimicrobiales bacterium]
MGVVALVVFLYFGATFVQIWLRGHEHTTKSAQAISAFGTREDNRTPPSELKARLEQALNSMTSVAPWVAVTGGRRPGDIFSEAGASATFLEDHGVPKSRIVKGGGSDTWQNVSTVIAALRRHHIKTVITVTDPFHEISRHGDLFGPGTGAIRLTGAQLAHDQAPTMALLPKTDPRGRGRAHRGLPPTE